MSFLAPLFLLGGLAIALPLVFHLIRRSTREQTPFSSLMFLKPTPPRLTRRSRLEHLLLLLLRCAVLVLLAVGFARPFIKSPALTPQTQASAKRMVVLLDTSASMRRANLWEAARDKANAILRAAAPGDAMSVYTFDRTFTPVVTFEEWNSTATGNRSTLAAQKLSQISPGWAATQLGSAVIRAAELLADNPSDTPGLRNEVVIITDFQEGARLEGLQSYEWPRNTRFHLEIVKASKASNAALQLVTTSDESNTGSGATVRVRVTNAPDSSREQFKVGWVKTDGTGFLGTAKEVYVPAGQNRVVAIPVTDPVANRIQLEGDNEPFDNTVFVTPPQKAKASVIYIGAESDSDAGQPLYFLRRALQQTSSQEVQLRAVAPGAPLTATNLQAATLLVVAGDVPENAGALLREHVSSGKTVLLLLRSKSNAPFLSQLLPSAQIQIEEERPANYAMLAEIDFQHPLMAPFADPRFSDFSKIHFWKYRKLNLQGIPDARVLARFDSGSPALAEVPVGKGRVLILTSGWHPEESQLALSTKFVPLLYSTLENSGAPPPPPVQFFVGDNVPIASSAGTGDGQSEARIQLPDASFVNLPATDTAFTRTLTPGVYSVVSSEPRRFVVNTDPAESKLTTFPSDELERLGAPSVNEIPAAKELNRKARLKNDELESSQKLWRWLILVALAVLLLETWLAGRTARRTAASTKALYELEPTS